MSTTQTLPSTTAPPAQNHGSVTVAQSFVRGVENKVKLSQTTLSSSMGSSEQEAKDLTVQRLTKIYCMLGIVTLGVR